MFPKRSKYLYAVCTGTCAAITAIPDEAFSGGMLGQGYAIRPAAAQTVFCAPADGILQSVAPTAHAYTLLTDDGLDVLIHIGVDTVNLGGEGFEALVKEGRRVKIGDPLVRADIDLIRERGFPTITAVLVTEPDKIKDVEFEFGELTGGRDAAMRYRLA